MNFINKLFSVILSISLLCSIAIVSTSAEDRLNDVEIGFGSDYGLLFDGYEPNLPVREENVSHTTLTSYDPRLTNSFTDIKSQGYNGVCAMFASTALMESAVLKNTGLKYSYSEQALRYITSNALRSKTGDTSDIGFYERAPGEASSVISGMSYFTRRNSPISNQIRWIAPNLESDVPYTYNDGDITYMNTVAHLFDSHNLPIGLDTSTSNAYATDTIYIDFEYVKDYILEYGAVFFTFCANEWNSNTNAFYTKTWDRYKAHGVIVVGWDDNYPKENFLEGMRPENDGAWLIKNSWGIDSNRSNDDGFYWVSYEDPYVNCYGGCAVVTDVAPVSKDEYMLSYDYTPMARHGEYAITQTCDNVSMANIYDISELADDYGSINKVMFYSADIGTFYRVYVVPMTSSEDQLTNTTNLGAVKAFGTVNYEGYITCDFSTPVTFSEDTEKVAIIIKFSKDYSSTDLTENKILLTQETTTAGYYNAISFPGESYYYNKNHSGSWVDVTGGNDVSSNGNFCIRPMLVRRESIAQSSTLSHNSVEYIDSDVTVNLNLNGNLLYSIKENGNTILYEDNQFTRTEDSVTFKSSYLSSLSENQYKNIVFEFTDGDIQTLTITRKSNLPEVSISGDVAIGQTLSSVIPDSNTATGITYQWQSSTDGTTWSDITNATDSTYTITSNEFLKYIRVKINSQSNSSYVYPQEKVSASTATKVVLYGDVDLDGRVSIKDSTQIQKYVAQMVDLNTEQFIAGDVNGDGYVNVTDSTLINEFMSGIITSFPVESN